MRGWDEVVGGLGAGSVGGSGLERGRGVSMAGLLFEVGVNDTLNTSVNGFSEKNIHGYRYRLFQCHSSCLMLCRMPSNSSLRTRLMMAALGRLLNHSLPVS